VEDAVQCSAEEVCVVVNGDENGHAGHAG
jgi:hypothetical protein